MHVSSFHVVSCSTSVNSAVAGLERLAMAVIVVFVFLFNLPVFQLSYSRTLGNCWHRTFYGLNALFRCSSDSFKALKGNMIILQSYKSEICIETVGFVCCVTAGRFSKNMFVQQAGHWSMWHFKCRRKGKSRLTFLLIWMVCSQTGLPYMLRIYESCSLQWQNSMTWYAVSHNMNKQSFEQAVSEL